MATTRRPLVCSVVLALALLAPGASGEATVDAEMARQLTVLFSDTTETLYCGCEFSVRGMQGTDACRTSPGDAAGGVAWSPLLTPQQLGELAQCSGDDCNEAVDLAMRDLQLWAPMREAVAVALADLRLGQTDNTSRGICGVSIDTARGVFMPPPEHRGRMARVLLYLQQHYDLKFDDGLNQLLLDWHFDNPPTLAETELNRWLQVVQGKGVSTSRSSIETHLAELAARYEAQAVRGRADRLEQDVSEKIAATATAVNRADSFRSALFYTSFYVGAIGDRYAYPILQGDDTAWQRMFDALEAHWLASQVSAYKVSDVETYGKMMSLALLTGQDDKAEAYAAAYLHPYNQRHLEFYIYDNQYPELIRAIAHLIRDDTWPTEVAPALSAHPYGQMFAAGGDDALFALALYDSGNHFFDMSGVILPHFRLTPFEFLAIVELRNRIFGTETPRLAHPMFSTRLAVIPEYAPSGKDPIVNQMRAAWGDLDPLPELIQFILDGELERFEAELERGADPSVRDHLGRTPVTLAAELNLTEVVRAALGRGAATGGDVGRSLHSALRHENYEMSSLLLEAGVDANYVWDGGTGPSTSAIRVVTENPRADLLGLLFAHGLDVSAAKGMVSFANSVFRTVDPAELRGAVDVLARNGLDLADADPFCQDLVIRASEADLNFLIDQGADVNKRYVAQSTPLICAAQYGSVTATNVLLDRGADRSAENRYGETALDTAQSYDNDNVAQRLRQRR